MLFKSLNASVLPNILILLPLKGGILVPRSELQLPVSHIENLSPLTEAIKEDRYVGVVQLREDFEKVKPEPVFRCGCAGRILDLQENEDGVLMFTIQGICRFEIEQELPEQQS